MKRNIQRILIWALIIALFPLAAQEHLYSPQGVAQKSKDIFDKMESFSSRFTINTVDGNRSRTMSGICYFQKPSKIRFEFSDPPGNLIVSDGHLLWVYISRLRIAGKQDLRLEIKNENDQPIFSDSPETGLARLFRKYHYRFDSEDQPRQEDGGKYFVLDMVQREKIGGYETIKLYIDAATYLIHKAVAADSYGKKTTITFQNPASDVAVQGSLFQYQPDESVRVVNNPLVNE